MIASATPREYEALEKLSESPRSEVWRGRRLSSGGPVILKILKPEAAAEGELARFRREFQITASADLSGIPKAFALEECRGGLCMVLEDIGGQSLDRLSARGPLPLVQFLELATRLAEALAGIHHKGIIHKDVNPSNIVANLATGEVRLIDFGIADELPRREVAPRPPAALEGTLAYLSPEQTGRMNRAVDNRTDFYSLGVTFYWLLTRRLPFEAEDALGMVHCHIAGTPTAPHLLDVGIPPTISRIVLKLMSKGAEDRYQSGWGLKADLERCRRGLGDQGRVPEFELGAEDFAERIQPPQKLYGRTAETGRLLQAFERAGTGECELFLVAGYAGVGKTALVREINKPLLEKRGSFLEGKFDQLRRSVPYSGWIQALEGFVSYLLMETESDLSRWRGAIQSAVGASGKVLTDVIRNLELVIGPQPALPELSGAEAQNRFNYVFLNFLQALATPEHPLVVFLDDLQWIDAASLHLLQMLLNHSGVSCALIVGAYRDNEVDALHPFARALGTLRQEGARVDLLTLQNLTEENVNELVADALRDQCPRTAPLAHLIHSKTAGNAFFTIETLKSLAERQALVFTPESRRWQWDISVLSRLEITDNVVALMLAKIQALAAKPRRALTLAACMGFRFSLSNLSAVAAEPEEVAQSHLDPALKEGLIVPAGSELEFVHDRVQQAAYALIPEAAKKRVHLEIGRLLLRRSSEPDREEQLFTVVDHLNAGAELMERPEELHGLARLNLQAGRKAKASAAFDAAVRYLEAGVALLNEQTLASDYDLALDLYSRAAEAATLVGNFDRTDQLFETVVRRARTPADMVGATMSRMMALSAQGRLPEFMACALDILGKLGVHIELHPQVDAIQRRLAEVRSSFDQRAIESLIHIPAASDACTAATMRVLDLAQNSAYSGRPDLFALFALEAVQRTLQFGRTPESMHAFAHLALLLCGLPGGDVEQGSELGNLAMVFAEKASNSALAPPSMATTAGMTWVYKRHLRDTLGVLQLLYPRLKEIGDFEYAGYAACWYCSNALLAGVELIGLEQEMAAYYEDMNRIRAEVGCRWLSAFWQAAQNLLGRSACAWVLEGAAYDRPAMLRAIVETGNLAAQTALHVNTLVLCYLFERHEEALAASELAEKCRAGMVAMPIEPVWCFYDSLTRLALCSRAPISAPEKERYLERVASNQSYLEMRARHAPMSFLHKWHLVEAERAQMLGDAAAAAAAEHYRRAIALARDHRFVQEEALANELAARFWAAQGENDYARLHLKRAHRGYSRWQAWAKVSALEAEHPVLEVRRAVSSLSTGSLDLVSVTKTARSITSEIELDRLLAAVLRIILENAGARSGFLLLERESQWSVAARDEIGAPEVEVARGRGSGDRDPLSQNVVRYVARTREWVVLDDAARHGAFVEDPHIVRERTRSLLCAPLLSRGRLIGILYLQNDLAAGAFTRDRVELLEILLSQAATSLENARSYEALLRANRELQESQAKLREAQRIAHVGYWDRDLAENRVELSDEACRIFGLQLQGSVVDIEHQRWLHLVHPEDRPRVSEALAAALQGGPPFRAEYRVVRPTGEVRFVRSEARLARDGSGHPQHMLGMLEDITERHDAAVLRESEERFRTMANAIPQLAWMARPDGHVYWYNQRWCEYTGIRPEQMQGWGWQVVHHPEVLPRVLEAWEKCLESCEAFEMEFPLRRADGVFRRFLTRVLPFRDSDGRVVQWFGTHTDVTELVEAQAVLKKERDFSSAVIDTVGALVVILDRQGCIRRFNRACEQATGYAFDEVRDRNVEFLVPVEQRPEVRETMAALLQGRRLPSFHENEWLAKDGSRRLIAWSNTTIAGSNGSVEHVIATGLDITARSQAQAALRQAHERLIEADRRKDEFLAVLSHELRNPLSPVRSSVYVLERAAPGGEQARRALTIIDRQAQHMTRLIDDLLDVTRISRGKINLQRERVDLNALTRGVAEDHRAVFSRNGVVLQVMGARDALWVDADPTRLAQVIGNLLSNSAKFTARGGRTVLSTEVSGRGEAIIRVRDNGAGISPESLPRLFVPFVQAPQTIERSQGGLGLGLALVKGLVEMHGGSVAVRSEGEGKGSEFTVVLPLHSPEQDKPSASRTPKSRSRMRRVLVVEDNADAAESLREALELGEHEVTVAHSGPEGVEAARRYQPDVVLCDIGLPEMDGYGVAKALRADTSASLRSTFLVALSGYARQEDVRRSMEAGFDRHMAKPPSIEAVEKLLAEATAGTAASEPGFSRS